MFLSLFEWLEKAIVVMLSIFMAIVVLASTGELAMLLFRNLTTPFLFHIELGELLDLFGYFLMILLGLELLEILKAYLHDDKVHVEVVLLVAVIAIARKIIILDLKETSPGTLLGLAGLLTALAGGYFVIRRVLPTPSK
jgi:uncharacterized membrane protein (DUF373 family)